MVTSSRERGIRVYTIVADVGECSRIAEVKLISSVAYSDFGAQLVSTETSWSTTVGHRS